MSSIPKQQRFILVVEDDVQLLNIIARSLQVAGYLVFKATNLREAEDRMAAKPHLMILDIQLPDATGWDVAKWLATFTSPVPIIVMSGHTTPTPKQLEQFEPKAFLTKPFAIKDLLKLVERYVSPA